MTSKPVKQLVLALAGMAVLVISYVALSYARWVYSVEEGNRAMAAGDAAGAERLLAAATQGAQSRSWYKTLAPDAYRQMFFNRARLLLAAEKDDDAGTLLEKEAGRSPMLTEDGEYYYWLGNIQLRRVFALRDKQAQQAALQQASESYKRALTLSPADWDARYNYELAVTTLAQMRKGKEDSLQKLKKGQMKLLRENNEKMKENKEQVAPEKRG